MKTVALSYDGPDGGVLKITVHRAGGVPNGDAVKMSFGDEDLSHLARFVQLAARLGEARAQMGATSLRMSGGVGKPTETQAEVPDELAVDAMLLRLRPFVLKDEACYYNRIHGLLYKQLAIEQVRALIAKWHRSFNHPAIEMKVVANGTELTSSEGLHAWLYGDKYHFDADRSALVERWRRAFGDRALLAILVPVLDVQIVSILNLAPVAANVVAAFASTAVGHEAE